MTDTGQTERTIPPPPAPETGGGLSRRALFGLAGAGVVVAGGAAAIGYAAGDAGGSGGGAGVVPFRDVHQAGVATPAQDRLHFVALDLTTTDRVAVARLLVFSTWRLALLSRLRDSRDPVVAAVAAKGVKELTYHRDWAARWALRLGDGTDESHRRMQAGLETVWPHVDELFRTSDVERRLVDAGVATDPAATRDEVDAVLDQVFAAATLTRPTLPGRGPLGGRAGRQGAHTEALGHVLDRLQSLARAHPGASW